MGMQSRGEHKFSKPKATRVRGRTAVLPQALPASVASDPAGSLGLGRCDVAPSPFDDLPLDGPVSFLEAGPGAAAPVEGLSEFIETPKASELPEPPHCP